jgi:prepilin-type N-terminal cleavage/methylation domain-containing protein
MMRKSYKAFTMVELLVAMAIIGLLIAVAIWGIGLAQQSARNTQRREAATQMVAAISEFYSRYNVQPTEIRFTADKMCLGINAADLNTTCDTGAGLSVYAINLQGIVLPNTTGLGPVAISSTIAELGTAATGDATLTKYRLGTGISQGTVTGNVVCVQLEGGGYANLSEPSALTCQ